MGLAPMLAKFLCSAILAAVLLPVQICNAQELRLRRVGVIMHGGPWYEVVDGLRDGLKDLGLADGKELVLEIRDTRGDLAAVEDAARGFERQKVDLICTVNTSVSLAAKGATKTTPIVFAAGTDPVVVKLADSTRRPGGRSTGVHFLVTDLTGKRLELLREMIPNLRRVVTFYDPNNRSASEGAKEGRAAAQRLGLGFMERHVASVEEFRTALQALKSGEADAYFAASDAMVGSQQQFIADFGRSKRLPTMSFETSFVNHGGLASYSADLKLVGRTAAKYVGRILAGANPADLPIEQIDRLVLAVNLKTAEQIGVTLPYAVLSRADIVVE
jgi:putative ABC transport system substrate-binding protein